MIEFSTIESFPPEEFGADYLVWDGLNISIAKRAYGGQFVGISNGELAAEPDGSLVYIRPTHWAPLPTVYIE